MTSFNRLLDLLADESVAFSNCLLKAKVFAGRLPGTRFRHWVKCELEGYPTRAEVPRYRIVPTPPVGHFINMLGEQEHDLAINPAGLPNEWRTVIAQYSLVEGAAALEKLAGAEASHFPRPWDEATVLAVRELPAAKVAGMVLTAASSPIPRAGLNDVLRAARDALLNFLLGLNEKNPQLERSEAAVPAVEATDADALATALLFKHKAGPGRDATISRMLAGTPVRFGELQPGADVPLGDDTHRDHPTATTDVVRQLLGQIVDLMRPAGEELNDAERHEAAEEFALLSREALRASPRVERLKTFGDSMMAAFAAIATDPSVTGIQEKVGTIYAYFGVTADETAERNGD